MIDPNETFLEVVASPNGVVHCSLSQHKRSESTHQQCSVSSTLCVSMSSNHEVTFHNISHPLLLNRGYFDKADLTISSVKNKAHQITFT